MYVQKKRNRAPTSPKDKDKDKDEDNPAVLEDVQKCLVCQNRPTVKMHTSIIRHAERRAARRNPDGGSGSHLDPYVAEEREWERERGREGGEKRKITPPSCPPRSAELMCLIWNRQSPSHRCFPPRSSFCALFPAPSSRPGSFD